MAVDFPATPTPGEIFERWRWDVDKWIQNNSGGGGFLPLAGGVMTGPITLAGNAAANLNPVPLQQLNSRLALYLPLSGGTLSGALFSNSNIVTSALVQGGTVNATGDLTAGGNIGTNNVLYAGAAQVSTFYANPTFTGSVTVNGNISTANGVYAALVQAPTYAGSVTITGSATVNGNIGTVNTVYAGAVQTPQLNGNVYVTGNLNSGGQVQGDSLYARNRIDAVGGIFCSNVIQSNRGDDLAFYAPYGGITVATAFVSNRGGGQYALYCPYGEAYIGGTLTAGGLASNGNISANGSVGVLGNVSANDLTAATGQVFSAHGIWAYTSLFGGRDLGLEMDTGSGDKYLSLQSGCRLYFQTSSGNTWWELPGRQIFVFAADNTCFAPNNWVGGNGAYVNFCDIRLKDPESITPATQGLVEILALNPVTFQRLPTGEEARPIELGFIAQDVQPVFPLAVTSTGAPPPAGADNPEENVMAIQSDAITAALVNAVKTLDARISALEGA